METRPNPCREMFDVPYNKVFSGKPRTIQPGKILQRQANYIKYNQILDVLFTGTGVHLHSRTITTNL